MMRFAFVSRHEPTEEQIALAEAKAIVLVPVGDMDAFTVTVADVEKHGEFDGVVVVHPASAMRLCTDYAVGVYENANRAPEGEKPQFAAKALHIYVVDV